MKILFCNYEYPPLGGGGGVVNALLAEELAKRHDITVLTSQAFDLPRDAREGGVRVVRVPVWFRRRAASANLPSLCMFMIRGVAAGKRLLRAQHFDVINTHFALPSGPVGDVLSRWSGVPNVLSVHGGDLYDPSKLTSPHRHPLLRGWVRRLLVRADRVVGQSRNTVEHVRRFYTQDVQPARVPLGIRRPTATAADRTGYGCSRSDVLLVTVGRLVARKAVHQLLTLMRALRDQPVRLLILGSGPAEAQLRLQATALGVNERVEFLGQVGDPEKFRVLKMCDLFISASQHEGFGLVFLEAMASGLPVVCYDHGGQSDFLEDGRTGYLVPLNDQERLIGRCRELVAEATLRRYMGEENLRRVEALFIDRCAEQYEALFREVISAGHAAAIAHARAQLEVAGSQA